jgi:multiple sugar transport system substrate-binding protein
MRFMWPWGGSLLDAKFKSNLLSEQDQTGLNFRQSLIKFMPPGIVDFDHSEAVNALAQGQVAMITEWSAFYQTLADPKNSKIIDQLGVAPEPKGPAFQNDDWRIFSEARLRTNRKTHGGRAAKGRLL